MAVEEGTKPGTVGWIDDRGTPSPLGGDGVLVFLPQAVITNSKRRVGIMPVFTADMVGLMPWSGGLVAERQRAGLMVGGGGAALVADR